jgi:cytochrome c2
MSREDKQGYLRVWLIGLCWLLAACGAEAGSRDVNTVSLTGQQARGKVLFQQRCGSCHSTLPGEVVVGPSMDGVGSRATERVAGMKASGYLEQSIRKPAEYIVDGFENLMPADAASALNQEDMDALVAYLLTLE